MTTAYLFPIVLTIIGGTLYHTSSKNVPDINPLMVLIIAYTIQIVICSGMMFVFPNQGSNILPLKIADHRWLVGLAIGSILLELGFILAYKAGWDLSAADITSVAVISILFVPIGMLFYDEPVTIKRVIGIVVCAVGLVLIN